MPVHYVHRIRGEDGDDSAEVMPGAELADVIVYGGLGDDTMTSAPCI